MVIRAAKHSLNRLLRSSGTFDHPYIVSHFLNCLLGASLNASPVAETPFLPNQDITRSWTSLSPSSLRNELIKEIGSRFRYTLPENWIETEMLKNKTARELCLRVGIQLVARAYSFESSSSAGSTETAQVSSNKRSQPQNTDATLASKKKNKKKSGKAAVNGVHDAKVELPTMTFTSDDVLNIMPVVKSTIFKVSLLSLPLSRALRFVLLTFSYLSQSTLVDERFAQGSRLLSDGYVEAGEQISNEALHLCEQVFGAVHPEAASKYHALGLGMSIRVSPRFVSQTCS